jgi:hypothetical protein
VLIVTVSAASHGDHGERGEQDKGDLATSLLRRTTA